MSSSYNGTTFFASYRGCISLSSIVNSNARIFRNGNEGGIDACMQTCSASSYPSSSHNITAISSCGYIGGSVSQCIGFLNTDFATLLQNPIFTSQTVNLSVAQDSDCNAACNTVPASPSITTSFGCGNSNGSVVLYSMFDVSLTSTPVWTNNLNNLLANNNNNSNSNADMGGAVADSTAVNARPFSIELIALLSSLGILLFIGTIAYCCLKRKRATQQAEAHTSLVVMPYDMSKEMEKSENRPRPRPLTAVRSSQVRPIKLNAARMILD